MFNADFYPTPDSLIEKMLAPFMGEPREETQTSYYGLHTHTYKAQVWQNVQLLQMSILEPSAGKGNILDYIVKTLKDREGRNDAGQADKLRRRMYAIESEPDLVAILQEREYRVLGNDFLEYTGNRAFDLIIANPPFSSGARHVLKMWAVVAPGGHVVSLINSASLSNQFSEERQLLAKIIADHGSVEELGAVFAGGDDVERKTNAEVSLIRLQKPAEAEGGRFDFKFGQQRPKRRVSEQQLFDAPACRDIVGNMMLCFEQTQEAFLDYLRAKEKLEFYGRDLQNIVEHGQGVLRLAEDAIAEKGTAQQVFNSFSDEVQQQLWGVILGKLDIQQLLTEKVRRDFATYAKYSGYTDFTKENVASMIALLISNRGNILEKAIEAVFDIFTSYHKENRLHVHGWATNSAWKVNRKIILPHWVRWNDGSRKYATDRFRLSWSNQGEYSDIDKALCFITGKDYKHICTVVQALESRFTELGDVGSGSFDGTTESTFFKLKFHKSGTLHLTFLDESLWAEFNLRACAGKRWLPEPEMKKYQARKRGPFDPEPAPVATATPEAPRPTIRQLGVGTQLSLLDAA